MKALVISGGGSKGAFAGGVAEALIRRGSVYDIYLGTSTGGLLVPFLATGAIQKIKTIYTQALQSQIFSNNPFRQSQTGSHIIFQINHLNVIKNFISGSKTFGESYALKDLIKSNFTENIYEQLLQSEKDIIVSVSNLSYQSLEYKSLLDSSYEDFCDWIWISCNFIPFMTLASKNGCEYADGSLGVSVAIEEAIRRGATTIDAIVLDVEDKKTKHHSIRNPFMLLTSMFTFSKSILEQQNIRVANDFAKKKGVKINYYHTPYSLTNNPLLFDQNEMKTWWDLGYKMVIDREMQLENEKP
jgi:NTE family protein